MTDNLFGTWPGDETEKELLDGLKELRKMTDKKAVEHTRAEDMQLAAIGGMQKMRKALRIILSNASVGITKENCEYCERIYAIANGILHELS